MKFEYTMATCFFSSMEPMQMNRGEQFVKKELDISSVFTRDIRTDALFNTYSKWLKNR